MNQPFPNWFPLTDFPPRGCVVNITTLSKFSSFGVVSISAAFISAFLLTSALVAVAICVCRKRRWVAKPRAGRWHKGTPASFGGVPLWLGFIIMSAIYLPGVDHLAWKLVALSSLMFCLGLVDDIFHIRPRPKFLAQVLAAALVVGCGVVYPLRGNLLV